MKSWILKTWELSCEQPCFSGSNGVVVCHKNSAPLSAVVAKASVGALEARPTYGVKSLMKFIP